MEKVRNLALRTSAVAVPVLVALAGAEGGGNGFNAGQVASSVMADIGGIAAAGVGVLALTIGLSAAWRYAKKFLKG